MEKAKDKAERGGAHQYSVVEGWGGFTKSDFKAPLSLVFLPSEKNDLEAYKCLLNWLVLAIVLAVKSLFVVVRPPLASVCTNTPRQS